MATETKDLDTTLLDILDDPRVGDITMTKTPPPPGWSVDYAKQRGVRIKARTLNILGRDGTSFHQAEFDSRDELMDMMPAIVEAIRDWPLSAARAPGEGAR